MKKSLLIVILCFIHIKLTIAQQDTVDIDNFYINFAVPDLSAFNFLGTDLNKVSRPSNLKELSAALLESNQNGRIAPAIAIEWSFIQTLSSNKKTIYNFQNQYLLNALQVSAGTNTDSTGTNLAIGFRWVPIDKSNILLNDTISRTLASYMKAALMPDSTDIYTNNVFNFFTNRINIHLTYEQILQLNNLLEVDTLIYPPPTPFTAEAAYSRVIGTLKTIKPDVELGSEATFELKALTLQYISIISSRGDYDRITENFVAERKKRFKDKAWNAEILQIASGFTWNSPEARWDNLRGKRWTSFIGYNHPLGKSGQIILHSQYSKFMNQAVTEQEVETEWNWFNGIRLLYGNSNHRGSLEFGYNYISTTNDNSSKNLRGTFGIEFKVQKGLWLEVVAGFDDTITKDTNPWEMILGANIKYSLQKDRRFDIP